MRFFLGLVVPPIVALPVVFVFLPTAVGALLWQSLSIAWLLFWFKRGTR
jgi:hypothetical protein